jgi:hypothetical protein
VAQLAHFLRDLLELLQDLPLLLPLLQLGEVVQLAGLAGGPALDFRTGALDVGDELHVFLEELVLVAEGVQDLDLGAGGSLGAGDAEGFESAGVEPDFRKLLGLYLGACGLKAVDELEVLLEEFVALPCVRGVLLSRSASRLSICYRL